MIATFYSFKGGVGRSMTLANVASLLSKWGKRVLIADWDLEAPGIEKFFAKWLRDEPGPKDGLVDLIAAWSSGVPLDWRACLVKARPEGGQEIHLITAGKADGKYISRLRAIDWSVLFSESRLGNYLEQLRREWRSEYDFVFLDSRTGVTDIGGICTIHFPDVLVAMFVANDQSLGGVKTVLESARLRHAQMPVDRAKLIVIPVPSRDESTSEHDLAAEWQNKFALELKDFFSDWVPREEKLSNVLSYLKIPYFPYWSFGERIPVLEQQDPDNPKTLAYAYQPLAKLLLGGLDWAEVREGSLATEEALKQAAEAERLKLEAVRIAEESRRRSEEVRANQMEAEAQNLKTRMEKFRSRVLVASYDWDRRHSIDALSQQIAIGAIVLVTAGMVILFVDWYNSLNMHLDALYSTALVCGAVCVSAVLFILVRRPGPRSRTAQLIDKQLDAERAHFESGVGPYSHEDMEGSFRTYASAIETILRDGEAAYSEHRPFTFRSPKAVPAPSAVMAPETRAAALSGSQYGKRILAPPTGYRFDVFLSYRRAEFTAKWISEFTPLFTFWLNESLGRDAIIFHDDSLSGSDPLFAHIEYSLRASRSLVAICTPSYFQSEWNRREWEYFDLLSKRPIIPVLLSPGVQLPKPGLQSWDFSRFAFIGDGFRSTELYVDFQRVVQEFARQVAASILKGPPFDVELSRSGATDSDTPGVKMQ